MHQNLQSSHFDVAPAGVFFSQQPQRAPTGRVAIERHVARHTRSGRLEGLAKQGFRGGNSAVTTQQQVGRCAVFVHRRIQIVPLRLDRDVGSIDAPRGANGSRESVPAILEQRNVSSDPPENSRLSYVDPTLRHHLDEVPHEAKR